LLNSHTGTSRAHPARFWEPAANPKRDARWSPRHTSALLTELGVPVPVVPTLCRLPVPLLMKLLPLHEIKVLKRRCTAKRCAINSAH
jgi:hypothetical protein